MAECAHCTAPIEDEAAYCPQCGVRVEGAEEPGDYEYEAFVSYRHLPHDTAVAKRIQREIEGYRIPKDLDSPRAGEKLGRLFRDEDELPTSSSLSEQIRAALKKSRYLVVVCTPDTLESRWVAQEVQLFMSFHGRDRVFAALAEAEPEDSFPRALLQRATRLEDGTIAREPTEPLGADFRDKGRYRQEALRIIAAMVGCGYDDLRQRQRARRNATIAKIGSAVAAVSLAFAGFSLHQQAQIVENQRQLQISQSRFLAKEVDELLAAGDREQAVRSALTALPASSTSSERPYVPEAQNALEKALQAYPTADGWYPGYARSENARIGALRVNEDASTYAVLDTSGVVHMYRIATGEQLLELDLPRIAREQGAAQEGAAAPTDWSIELSDSLIVAYAATGAFAAGFDSTSGTLLWTHAAADETPRIEDAELSSSGNLVALACVDSRRRRAITVLDAQTGDEVSRLEAEDAEDRSAAGHSAVRFSPDDSRVAASFGQFLLIGAMESGKTSEARLKYAWCTDLMWAGENVVAASMEPTQFDQNVEQALLMLYRGSLQCFSEGGKTRWETDAELPTVEYGNARYESHVRFWSSDLDGNGTHKRILASIGRKLVAVDSQRGTFDDMGSYNTPIVGCTVAGASPNRLVYACTADGQASLCGPRGRAEEYVDLTGTAVGGTSEACFAIVPETTGDVEGYLVSLPDERGGSHSTIVHALRSTDALRTDTGLADLYRYCGNCDGSLVAGIASSTAEDGAACVLDAQTFAPMATLRADDLQGYCPSDAELMCFSANSPHDLYLFFRNEDERVACRFDLSSGALAAMRKTGRENMEPQTVCAGNGAILASESGTAQRGRFALLDPDTFETIASCGTGGERLIGAATPDARSSSSNAWSDGSHLALSFTDGAGALFDLQTGTAVNCDFSAFAFAGKAPIMHGGATAASGADAFALGSSETELACFDLPSGAERWHRHLDRGALDYLGISPDGSLAFAQASGILEILDTATGTVTASSASPIERIQSCTVVEGTGLLVVNCSIDGDYLNRTRLLVIDAADATLTPKSAIDYGIALSSGADRVLVDDDAKYRPGVWAMPYRALDELIEQGAAALANAPSRIL